MADRRREYPRTDAGCHDRMAAGLIAVTVASVAVSGCFGPRSTDGSTGSSLQCRAGIVDASLPAAESERREVVQRLLVGIVEGKDVGLVARWLPGVEFEEPPEVFFNGNLLLRSWDFAPVPRPGVIPVVLEFVPADDALATKIEQRTYEVTGRRGAWVVERVALERVAP